LEQIKLPAERGFFEPCPNTKIIQRMLTNLISAFQQVNSKYNAVCRPISPTGAKSNSNIVVHRAVVY
jgi:hypothetical protein